MLVKICGITTPETAVACIEAGADMIGLVYYPPSPRHVEVARINEIIDPAKSLGSQSVLVVVDQLPDGDVISRFAFIQPYGTIKDDISLPHIQVVKDFDAFTCLLGSPAKPPLPPYYALEMSEGRLPGGNGAAWDWSLARPFCERFPTFIAGGVTPENVGDIIRLASPVGIDVSSGVESAPGIKDMDKVKRLIENVRLHIKRKS